jgi:transposase
MKAYSADLRERVVAACKARELSQEAIAERYAVSYGLVKKVWAQWRKTGSCLPGRPGTKAKRSFDAAAEQRLHRAVRDNPDATLSELADVCGVACCEATVCNTLKRLGYRRKKNATRLRT